MKSVEQPNKMRQFNNLKLQQLYLIQHSDSIFTVSINLLLVIPKSDMVQLCGWNSSKQNEVFFVIQAVKFCIIYQIIRLSCSGKARNPEPHLVDLQVKSVNNVDNQKYSLPTNLLSHYNCLYSDPNLKNSKEIYLVQLPQPPMVCLSHLQPVYRHLLANRETIAF